MLGIHGGERLLDRGGCSGGNVAPSQLMKLREHGIGLSERSDAFHISGELCSRQGKEGDVIFEDIEVGPGPAAAETECRAACVHDLRNDGTGGTSHGGNILLLDLLNCFAEDEGLAGINDQ